MMPNPTYLPLFYQSWWLEAIAPGKVFVNNNEAFHYSAVEVEKWGLKKQFSPVLTPYGGPWVKCQQRPGNSTPNLKKFQQSADHLDEIYFRLHPSFTELDELQKEGFELRERKTHILDVKNLDSVWKEMLGSTRRAIKKGGRHVEVSESGEVDLLYDVHKATFDRQGLKALPLPLLRRVYKACTAKGCGRILVAKDKRDSLHAAILLVWDERYMYYLMGGSMEPFRSSGAMSLLLWEAINQCNNQGIDQFDFEGSMLPNVARFFRGFGARPVSYYEALKTKSRLLQLRNKLKGKPW